MNEQINSQSMVAPLHWCLMKRPGASHRSQSAVDEQWQALNYTGRPLLARVEAQHDTLVDLLAGQGVELAYLPEDDVTGLDSIYTHDPIVTVAGGVILGRMGKALRQEEPDAVGRALAKLGVPILGRITGDGRLEGGDVCWLDERTVAVGQGYRTNAEGIRQLHALLGERVDDVIPVPLPHWTGPDDCLHLLSFISPVDVRKAVVYSRLMPVPFRQLLLERGWEFIEVPDAEYESMACNVLAVAPGRCIMLAGNPETQARLEAAGLAVKTFEGDDLCLKGGGGPTCLTRPLFRA